MFITRDELEIAIHISVSIAESGQRLGIVFFRELVHL
jgi:hypothetical protein